LDNACYSLTNKVINQLHFKSHHVQQESTKETRLCHVQKQQRNYQRDSCPIVDNDPGFDPPYYELLDDNTKKKKFTDIIQFIIDLCDSPSDSLMVEYITNEAWSILTDVTTIMVDEVDDICINKKDG
jgi:hypothetical protein